MIPGYVTRRKNPITALLGTPGNMVLPMFACDTLELPWANNERGMSCIKADTYRGRVWWSPTFARLVLRMEDKHGRKDVLVHNANFAATVADTDNDGNAGADLDDDGVAEVFQLRGCTAVGNGYGEIQRKDGRMQWGIKSSAITLAALIQYLVNEDLNKADVIINGVGYHDVELAYAWAEGCAP